MRQIERFIKLFAPIQFFMNTLGPVIAAIWLLALGEWKLVLVFFVATTFLAPRVIAIALIPHAVIGMTALRFATAHNRFLTYLFVLSSQLYTAALMVVWSTTALNYFAPPGDTLHTFNSAAPYLLWAYGVATAPWTYLTMYRTGKDDELNVFENSEDVSLSQFLCFFLQIGAIAAVLAILLFGASLTIGDSLIIGVMLIGVCAVVPLAGHQMLHRGALQSLGETVERLTRR
jgi:hypothetical protein